jgi:4-hydroxybenzoate polyprenyltransferase
VASRAALEISIAPPGLHGRRRVSPIAVDLDNSLLEADTLHESLIQLLSRKPWMIFALLLMILRGKPAFKQFVHEHAPVEVGTLPVRDELLDYLHEQKRLGRPVGLFSAAHQEVVDACSARFGIFDVAVGTTATCNLVGSSKLASIKQHFGGDFVYAGDSSADLSIWREARGAIYLGRSRRLRTRVANAAPLELDLSAPTAGLGLWAHALRVHQWSKNLLLFVPALLSIPMLRWADALNTALAFVTLCAIVATTYIINDLADVAADREHPSKRRRPFACGAIPLSHGLCAALVFAVIATALALVLPTQCALTLAFYAAVSLSYSFKLKRVPILDVICLGFLFTIRIAVGASLLENNAPYWLYAFSMFFFTSLAFVKRYTELAGAAIEKREDLPGRSYLPADLPLVLAAGLGSALCSIVVFLIYLGSQHFDANLFRNPAWLGLSVAALAYWLLRAWLLALRGEMHDDPVVFALKDRASYALAGLVGLSLLLAW